MKYLWQKLDYCSLSINDLILTTISRSTVDYFPSVFTLGLVSPLLMNQSTSNLKVFTLGTFLEFTLKWILNFLHTCSTYLNCLNSRIIQFSCSSVKGELGLLFLTGDIGNDYKWKWATTEYILRIFNFNFKDFKCDF